MIFTTNEEEILKALIVKQRANKKLNDINLKMGNEIRTEFKLIDERIRNENKDIITTLQNDLKVASENLEVKFE